MRRSGNWVRFGRLLPWCVVLFGIGNSSPAATIRFDELGTDALIDVNGLHIQNVHFGFSPEQAFFNQIVGTEGTAVLSIDPVLTGPTTGALTLTFDSPTTLLRFDIFLQSIFTIDDSNQGPNGAPAYAVQLSNGMSLAGGTAPQENGVYSEGEFVYSGDAIDCPSHHVLQWSGCGWLAGARVRVGQPDLQCAGKQCAGTAYILWIGYWPAGNARDEAAA